MELLLSLVHAPHSDRSPEESHAAYARLLSSTANHEQYASSALVIVSNVHVGQGDLYVVRKQRQQLVERGIVNHILTLGTRIAVWCCGRWIGYIRFCILHITGVRRAGRLFTCSDLLFIAQYDEQSVDLQRNGQVVQIAPRNLFLTNCTQKAHVWIENGCTSRQHRTEVEGSQERTS